MTEEHAEFVTEEDEGVNRLERFRDVLARIETIYLEVLRAAALIVATLILFWIAWLLVSSAYRISRDADDVELAPVEVTAQQVVDLESENAPEVSQGVSDQADPPSKFDAFRDKYFALYQSKFEKYKKDEDEELSKDDFTEIFLSGFAEDGAMTEDPLDAAADIVMADAMAEEYLSESAYVQAEDFADLYSTMDAASTLPVTIERLEAYRDTPKVRSERKVNRTREESYCSYYSDYFGECLSYGSRTVPFQSTVVDMVTPDGILEPQALFAAYQDTYLSTLSAKREESSSNAAQERSARLEDNAKGWLGFSNALWFAGTFLVLMFFFLLVAMERHQRRMAAELQGRLEELSSE